MDFTTAPDVSLTGRIIGFFKKIARKKRDRDFELATRFSTFLNGLDKKDDSFKLAEEMVMLCEEGIKIARQRITFIEKIRVLDEKLIELDAFSNLSDEDAAYIKDLLDRFLSLSKERRALVFQLTSFDSSINYMDKLEDEANAAMDDIQDAEKRQRILKHDLGYLEGEKADLEYEREFLAKGLTFIYRFTIFIISLFGVAALVMAFMYLFRGASIFLPLSIFVLLLIFVVFLLNVFRRRMVYEMQLNMRKQQRAILLLNKKTAVYAHYTNFLNYEYKKYRVKNSQMLTNNLKDLGNYKHLAMRVDGIRNIMYQTEAQIEDFLRDRNLGSIKSTVEQFAQTVNIDNKRQYHKDLSEDRLAFEKNLTALETRQSEIWRVLSEMEQKDSSENQILNRLFVLYQNEISEINYIPESAPEGESDNQESESVDNQEEQSEIA